MNEIFLKNLNKILNCDPNHCEGLSCPLCRENGKCTWKQVLSAFDIAIEEKFKNKNKNFDEYD